jgi:uncharacterized protein (DUF1778 family)
VHLHKKNIMATKELNLKDERFDTRLPKEQKVFFERAARLGGFRNLTEFVVTAANQKAKEIISERKRVIASEKDSEVFFNAVLSPKAPNSELLKAADEFKALFA